VRGGGALYASLNGESAIPEMEELFGARLADRIPAHDLRIKIVAPFGDLKPGDEFTFASGGATGDWGALLEPRDGRVIATDQSGHPALIAHTLGKGKVLTCAYPIEKYLSRVPAAFDDGDSTHRLYRALAEWAGVEPLFRSDRAEVEAAALTGSGRGYVVLTNHSDAAQTVTVTASKALRSVQLIQPEGASPLELHGKVFTIRVAPFGGEIVEYRELPQ
jgi:hemin uptake protein HemP